MCVCGGRKGGDNFTIQTKSAILFCAALLRILVCCPTTTITMVALITHLHQLLVHTYLLITVEFC